MKKEEVFYTHYQPDWDINVKQGAQAELWVSSIRDLMAKANGEIEVKAPKPFLKYQSPYVEYACQSRDGTWRKSGIATTKAKAWFFTFGSLPGGWLIETEWLKRAAREAYRDPRNRREETHGSNPTKGVVVSMFHLFATREHEP